MGYPGRHNIYEAAIRKMVAQALEAQELAFRQAHENDTEEQLLTYLQACASRLQHTPWPREIAGGRLIEERFGTWKTALLRAKLSPPRTPNQFKSFARVRAETERQKLAYRQKKADKKERAQKRQAEQAAKKKQPE